HISTDRVQLHTSAARQLHLRCAACWPLSQAPRQRRPRLRRIRLCEGNSHRGLPGTVARVPSAHLSDFAASRHGRVGGCRGLNRSPTMRTNDYPHDFNHAVLLSGSPEPLGATLTEDGVNFAVYSSGATRIELCLFDEQGEHELARLALPERTDHVWHGFLPRPYGVAGLVYGYRVHGRYDPQHGARYNPSKLLLDPYARSLAGTFTWHPSLFGYSQALGPDEPDTTDSGPYNYKARVISNDFDWSEDVPPAIPWRDTVIYELHIKGFTQMHPRVPEELRGKYLGLAHPEVLNYLKHLGVTSLELMPVQAFVSEKFLVDKGLTNYWGYSPIALFAPAPQYAIRDPVNEFKTMVKAIHAAGLEVILDVVFNHT